MDDSSWQSVRILVVEDEATIRDALTEGLADAGFTVRAAADGVQAIQMMLAEKPDFVLLDLMMPRMSGWQLIQEMKESPLLQDVPLAVVTAARNVGSVPKGYPVWVKPLKMDHLTRSIRGYVS
jgi:CheY-like chemotaxis protein